MNCTKTKELLPLYLSGELDAKAMAEFELHLGACPACAEELKLQQQFDAILREAADEQLPDARALRASVRRRMQAPHGWREWLSGQHNLRLAGIAALIVVTLAAGLVYYSTRQSTLRDIYAAAAKDHFDDVVRRVPKEGWHELPAEVAALVRERIGDPALTAELAPATYRLVRVRMCNLNGNAFGHLIYEKDGQTVSVFVRRSIDELPGAPVDTINGHALHAQSTDDFKVAGFQSGDLTVLVVSDLPAEQNLRLARETASRLA